MSLVVELKKGHASIVEVLDRVRERGIGSSEGQAMLLQAREGLLAHLKQEDAQLYPELRRAAERDEKLKRILTMFADDMAEISKVALDFFRNYASGGTGLEFARDYGRLVASLRQRIQKEETVLYVEYEKLKKS